MKIDCLEVVLVDETPPKRVQQRFRDLKKEAKRLFSDLGEPQLFIELSLGFGGNVWFVKVRTNELPPNIFDLLGPVIDEINKEEELTFFLTMENPKYEVTSNT